MRIFVMGCGFYSRSEGYAVMEAEDGRQGLYCLNDEVDLVIL